MSEARFPKTEPATPFTMDDIENRLNVVADQTHEAIFRHDDLAEQLDIARASLAEILSAESGDVATATAKGVELKTRIGVLESQLEGARQTIIKELELDRARLLDLVGEQRAHHITVRDASRAEGMAAMEAIFGRRQARTVMLNFSKVTLAERADREILDTLICRQQEIDRFLSEYQTNEEKHSAQVA